MPQCVICQCELWPHMKFCPQCGKNKNEVTTTAPTVTTTPAAPATTAPTPGKLKQLWIAFKTH